jgi:hypothetical protein
VDELVYIRTQFGCPIVGRRRVLDDGSEQWERALNLTELASEAIAAIVAQGGVRWVDGEFPCPPELAARARWQQALEERAAAA